MSKTKHLKKRSRLFKKTRKYIGGDTSEVVNTQDINNSSQEATNNYLSNLNLSSTDTPIPTLLRDKKGVFDIIGDRLSDFSKKTTDYVKDKALRLAGLQPIPEEQTQNTTDTNQTLDNNNNQTTQANQQVAAPVSNQSNSEPGIISDAESAVEGLLSNVSSIGNSVANVANEGSAAVIGNINDVLRSPQVENSITEAASQTAEIGTDILQKFNEKLNDPQFKETTKETLDNFADYAQIGVDALDEPLNSAIDVLNDSFSEAAGGIASGIIKVGTDAVAATPGVGAIIEVGQMINDGSKAIGSVVKANSEAAETIADLYLQTNAGIKKGIQELNERKKEAENIRNRTSDSINQFQNPLSENTNKVGGFNKSKKRLFKRKTKTKRVRFLL